MPVAFYLDKALMSVCIHINAATVSLVANTCRKASINTVPQVPSYGINFTDVPAVSVTTGALSYYYHPKVPCQVGDIS
jgi:hypothetical protein